MRVFAVVRRHGQEAVAAERLFGRLDAAARGAGAPDFTTPRLATRLIERGSGEIPPEGTA